MNTNPYECPKQAGSEAEWNTLCIRRNCLIVSGIVACLATAYFSWARPKQPSPAQIDSDFNVRVADQALGRMAPILKRLEELSKNQDSISRHGAGDLPPGLKDN